MKIVSLFSGIGAFEEGLRRANIDYTVVGFSELNDGYGKAVQKVYKKLHGENSKYLGDIKDIKGENLPHDIDLITHGSPCQSFSVAGDREGGDKGSGTTSSLMWETVRIVRDVKPKYVIWENVKGVLNKNNIHNFNLYLESLEELGFNNYYELLKGNDFGVPQKRGRIFVVSIRTDIDNGTFELPNPTNQNSVLRDILEENTSDQYLVPTQVIKGWQQKKPPFGDRFSLLNYDDIGFTLTAKSGRAVITNNYVLANEKDYLGVEEFKGKSAINTILANELPLRALTPREYWRMQGWDDSRIDEAFATGISDARLYKMAGNSIVVNIVEEIFKNLFKERNQGYQIIKEEEVC